MERLKLDISGMDELFRQNIPAPSVFALCGGPGTGKTTLALQMAYSVKIISEKNVEEPCNPAFLTFDADTIQILELANLYQFSQTYKTSHFAPLQRPLIYSLDTEIQTDDGKKSLKDIIRDIVTDPYPFDGQDQASNMRGPTIVNAVSGLIRRATRSLMNEFEKSYQLQNSPGRKGIIILDGLSTILAYVPQIYRRMVLHYVVNVLRDWYRLGAAILTFELSTSPFNSLDSKGTVQLEPEHYLADIVFWLMVKEMIPGKRRRMLEVIKARRADVRMGEHSIWIMDPDRVKGFQKIPLRGFGRIKSGFVVFPAQKAPHVTTPKVAPPSLVREETGLPCLDEMFGSAFAEDISPINNPEFIRGIFKGSTTAILGSAGSGKTLIGLAFALAGLTKDNAIDVKKSSNTLPDFGPRIFCSFDATEKELLASYGNFRPPKPLYTTLSESIENMTLREAWDSRQLRILYRSPDNFDPSFFFWLLEQELKSDFSKVERIVLDSISDLERTSGSEPAFQDFMTNLIALLKRYEVTSLFNYECPVDLSQRLVHVNPISFMVDNIIVTAQVPINDVNRKCVVVVKSRGQPSVSNPRELVVRTSLGGRYLTCRVVDTFDEYSQLLHGRPEPVEIHLRLFGENEKEIKFNKEFVDELSSRYPKIQYSTFTKTDLREVLWEHHGIARSQALRSDITVVSIDEPWFHQLVLPQSEIYPILKENILSRLYVYGDRIDAFRKQHLMLFLPHIMLASCVKGNFYGLPQYYDMGFLFYRTDLLEKYQAKLPTTLGKVTEISNNSPEDGSWLHLLGKLSKRSRMFGFAIETSVVGNLICPFIEFCWNYGAVPNFLERAQRYSSRVPVEDTLRALAWLVFHNLMPYPCSAETTGKAIFSRHWYSTFQDMKLSNKSNNVEYGIMKFPVHKMGSEGRDNLRESIKNYAKAVSCSPDDIDYNMKAIDSIKNSIDFIKSLKSRYAMNFLFEKEDDGTWKVKDTVLEGGWSCSGGWYTGVLRSGRSVEPGWIVASELVDEARVIQRAYEGAGLPPTEDFYKGNWHRQVPDIPVATFGRLYQKFFPCTRHRYEVFGFLNPTKSSLAYEMFADELYAILAEFLSKCVGNIPSEGDIKKVADAIFQRADNALDKVKDMV